MSALAQFPSKRFRVDYDQEADVLYMSQPVSRLQQVIEMVELLSPDEQRQLIEVVRQRLARYQRTELVREVAEARQAYQQGNVQHGTVADLMRELDRPTIVETSRGLSIAGTRITLYDILVLQQAEQVRHYWEAHNQERFAQIDAMPPKPGQEDIRARLAAWKAQLESA